MAQLYGKCFQEANIIAAIEHCNLQTDVNLIKNIKNILRRCKKTNDTSLQIAHRAVYQIIQPIIESHMSLNSYKFRRFTSKKIPVCKICSKVTNSKETFIIQFDFQQLLLNITDTQSFNNFINISLDTLRKLGINDAKLLKTIKHLIYIPDMSYEQIFNTLLGQVLINCYLSTVDSIIEKIIDRPSKNFRADFQRHKEDYISWLYQRKRKPAGLYYRYGTEAIILINTRVEQLEILRLLNSSKLNNFEINTVSNIKLGYNRFNFLGYTIIKRYEHGKPKIGITPANPKEIYKIIRSTKWNTYENICQSLCVIIDLLNKFDICNNIKFYLNRLGLRIMKIARRKNSILHKLPGKVVYEYMNKDSRNVIDIYKLRKLMKVSFKEYLLHPDIYLAKDRIRLSNQHIYEYQLYRWGLWIKQKGRDITGNRLKPNELHIHHINGIRTNNNVNNLILTTPKTHRLIHANSEITDPNILKYRKLLKK